MLLLISKNPAALDFVDIPVFLGFFNGFYTSQVISLISEPSTAFFQRIFHFAMAGTMDLYETWQPGNWSSPGCSHRQSQRPPSRSFFTASFPLKSNRNPIGKDRLPVPPFFKGRTVKLRGCSRGFPTVFSTLSSKRAGVEYSSIA